MNILKRKPIWFLFCIICAICIIVFFDYITLKKAYYFYDISSDGYYNFYPTLYNVADYITQHGVPSWSFKIGMGQNIFPYALRDPFDIIYYIFGKESIVNLTVYVEILKIILTGVVFFKYLRTIQLSNYTAIFGSLLLCFCGFITEGSAWFVFTYEAFNFVVFLWAFELLYTQNKWHLFPVAVFLVCICLPFDLYLYGVFIFFYALFRYLVTESFSLKKIFFLYSKIAGCTILGILLSGPFFLQSMWLLLHSPRGADPHFISNQIASLSVFGISNNLQLGSSILRFFSNDILGSGNNFRGWDTILGSGLFYCGLPCLLLLPQLFSHISRRKQIIHASFLLLWIVPIIFPFFRRAFWLFTGDYFRMYSLFVGFVFLYFAVQALEYILVKRKINHYVLLISLLILLMLLYHPVFIDVKIIEADIRNFVSAMLISYVAAMLILYESKYKSSLKFAMFVLLFIELSFAGWMTANKRDAFGMDWLKNGKAVYNDFSSDAVKYIQSVDRSFYRIDKNFDPPSARYSNLNFSQKQGYNSTAAYEAFNQLYYIKYLQLMGIADENNEADSRWAIGLFDNPILESGNNVKYFLSVKGFIPKWPEMWDSINRVGDVTVFKNKYVLPFGYSYNKYIKESVFKLASQSQRKFITMQAVVVSDKIATDLVGFQEFHLNDTLTTPLNFDAFRGLIDSFKLDTLSIKDFQETKIMATTNLTHSKIMYLPIPYDEGWHIFIDGKEIKPILLNGGMLGAIIEKGEHQVSIIYQLRFIKIGFIMIAVAILSMWYLRIRSVVNEAKKQITTE